MDPTVITLLAALVAAPDVNCTVAPGKMNNEKLEVTVGGQTIYGVVCAFEEADLQPFVKALQAAKARNEPHAAPKAPPPPKNVEP